MTGVELAEQFEAANMEAIDYVLGPAREHWEDETEPEGWPVGVTARHIGLGHELMTGWARAIKDGSAFRGVDDIDAVNAEQAARGIVATPEEVAQLLREGGVAVAAALRALSEDDLAGEVDFGGRVLPAAGLAGAALRHVQAHLASIQAVVEGG